MKLGLIYNFYGWILSKFSFKLRNIITFRDNNITEDGIKSLTKGLKDLQ